MRSWPAPAAIKGGRESLDLDYTSTPEQAAADFVLVLTAWRQYRELDPSPSRRSSRASGSSTVANALDREAWTAAGWAYRALGSRFG
ncbi:hypothetical protein ACI784_07415 [Geodermatophilus sp. SYSU D01186]